MLDQTKEVRLRKSLNATVLNMVFTDDEIELIRADKVNGLTYRQLVEKWKMSGKGQAHYIVNHKYQTKK